MSKPQLSPAARKARSKRRERLLGIAAIITIILAWFMGWRRADAYLDQYLAEALPEATRFEDVGDDIYAAYTSNSPETLIGYVTIGTADGYGGPMKVAVAVDLDGNVLGLSIIEQKETTSWINRVLKNDYLTILTGKSYADNFEIGQDVDGVTGATYTSRAIAEAALQGSREIASLKLGLDVPTTPDPAIRFGVPEITLIVLFTAGYFGHQRGFKYKKQVRWLTMLTGLVVLGFMFNQPLTISFINKLLMGFWPQWQTHLYWYLLIGGILFVYTVDNKNPYCEWFCPFGAAQECMAAIGGTKQRGTRRYKNVLKWGQRGLAWGAIVIALLLRNPGPSSYEIFGTLFDFVGSGVQFALLGIVLVASMFWKRPWCDYLCPLAPVTGFIQMMRSWIKELWQKLNPKPAS